MTTIAIARLGLPPGETAAHLVVGVWAVTNAIGAIGFVVTHVPTGCSLASFGPDEIEKARQLVRLLPQSFMADAKIESGRGKRRVRTRDDASAATQWLAIGATRSVTRESDSYVLANEPPEGEGS